MKRECETCIKRKTTYCPNSIECMDTNDMPFYQNRIMLLEENNQLKCNWNKLKECLKEVMNSSNGDDKDFVETILNIIQELEQESGE